LYTGGALGGRARAHSLFNKFATGGRAMVACRLDLAELPGSAPAETRGKAAGGHVRTTLSVCAAVQRTVTGRR